MRVLFVTSEVAPIIKTGGLADVSAALPAALLTLGVDVRVLVPGYPQVLKALPKLKVAVDFSALATAALASLPPAHLLRGKLPNGVPIYVLDCAEMYLRGGGAYQDEHGYDWADNAQRFGLFSKIAALLGSAETPLSWKPQIVHCNDWQSGLTPAYLHYAAKPAATLMTVHNLAFQGNFPPEVLPELGLPWECYQPDGLEFYNTVSFMKAGLYYADHITTVSPSYAQEIQSAELGFGMQGLLTHRRAVLSGILNGIDVDEWNPAADPLLEQVYDAEHLTKKAANKRALQHRLGLHVDAEIPLFGLVSRFAHQKGLDVVLEAAAMLIAMPAQLVILGSGDLEMQRAALALAHHYSGKVTVYIGFDEGLAHLIEAGADIFLMPSRFEPCGLNQMYSQRYGTPPLVHATGGLIDTVVDCNAASLANNTASGFVFMQMDAPHLLAAAKRAISSYRDKKVWKALQRHCMGKDFSWGRSAQAYFEIYTKILLGKQKKS